MEQGKELGQNRIFLPSFSRRKSRGFRVKQKQRMLEILPKYSEVANKWLEYVKQGELSVAHNAALVFPDMVYLEIGFGCGEHIVELADLYPNALFIGCEVFLNGVASLLRLLEEKPRDNIGLYPDDGRNFLNLLLTPSTSSFSGTKVIDTTYLLFPDPWHKLRHNKRRLINREFLDNLSSVSKRFIVASDHDSYAIYVREVVGLHENIQDFNYFILRSHEECATKHITTKYCLKALEQNKNIHYFEITFA